MNATAVPLSNCCQSALRSQTRKQQEIRDKYNLLMDNLKGFGESGSGIVIGQMGELEERSTAVAADIFWNWVEVGS
jgi:hypothetical protein